MTVRELRKALNGFKGSDYCDVRVGGRHVQSVEFKSLAGTWPDKDDNLTEQHLNFIEIKTT